VARARGNVPMKSNLCQGQENPVETARICKDQAACEPEQVIACTLRTRVVSVRAPEHAGVTNGEILVETSGEQGEVTDLIQRVDVDRVHPPPSTPRFIDLSYGHYRVTAKDTVSQCSSTVEAELRPVCRQIEL